MARRRPAEKSTMYIPESFKQSDPDQLFDFIEKNSFGLLVSQVDGEPFASHLPFLLDRTAAPNGALIGHMALANAQWRQADGQTVLAIFSGAHAYISPTWYEAEPAVPTWNYVAVHVYGTLQLIQDADTLGSILRGFVAQYESALPRPWQFDAGSDYAKKMMKAIAGFRIDIRRVEGKWKLNQNRPEEQRARVARVLQSFGDENSQAIAALMKQTTEWTT
jgi:transcriptional regulator